MSKNAAAVFSRPTSRTLRRWHKINAAFLGLYIILHLINHLSGVAGVNTYHAVQSLFRVLYKNPVLEPLLLFSMAIQIILGIILLWKTRKIKRPTPWTRLQFWSGLVFLLTISQHLFAFAYAQYGLKLDTTFYWPASVMNHAPSAYYFGPYYFLMVSSLFTHIGVGVRSHIMANGKNKPYATTTANQVAIGFIVIGVIVAALIVAVLGQVFYPVILPNIWVDYLNSF